MRAVIGIDRKIKRAWLDVLLDHLAQTTDPEELRRFMDERLAEELPGAASRAKSVGISLKIWSGIPANRVPLRDRAVALLPKISGQERVWLHWGMTSLAYPFFRDTAEVVGRLLTLQDDFTTAQVQERLLKKWGDRATTKEAAQKLLHTLVDWEVMRSTKTKGHFLLVARMSSASTPLQLWLLESLLTASSAEEVEAQQLLRLPEMFPFTLSIGLSDLRRHDGFHLHRQGLDMDMVALRPSKVPVISKPVKPAKKNPPRTKAVVSAHSLFDRMTEDTPQSAESLGTVPSQPSDTERLVPPTVEVAAVIEDASEELAEVPTLVAMTNLPIENSNRAEVLADLEFKPEGPLSAPLEECFRLYQEGFDFGCVALAHSLIEAMLRLVCRVRLGPRQARASDIRNQFGALSAIGVLPVPLKTRIEQTWLEGINHQDLEPSKPRDREKLEKVAESHISLLIELERQFFGYEGEAGRIMPHHVEYWPDYNAKRASTVCSGL